MQRETICFFFSLFMEYKEAQTTHQNGGKEIFRHLFLNVIKETNKYGDQLASVEYARKPTGFDQRPLSKLN